MKKKKIFEYCDAVQMVLYNACKHLYFLIFVCNDKKRYNLCGGVENYKNSTFVTYFCINVYNVKT